MQVEFLGDIVRRRRLALGLTQEQLCSGICEPITISRLENGKQTPARNRINALLQRLGLPDDRYYALLHKDELELEALEQELISDNIRFRRSQGEEKRQAWEKAQMTISKLEAFVDEDDRLTRQLILRSRATLGTAEGPYPLERQLEMLYDALRITVPHFDPEEVRHGLYSDEEIKLITHIANVLALSGEHRKAISMFDQLLSYAQKRFRDLPQRVKHLSLIAYNYARELDAVKRYEEAIEVAEIGRRECINYEQHRLLPSILAVMAECFYFLGNRKESERLYYQAYYLCTATENAADRAIIQQDARKYLQLEFLY